MSNINKARIQELILAYGADTRRWPEAERQAGQAWLVNNPGAAQNILSAAQELDKMLDRATKPAGNTSLLQARILKTAERTAQNGAVANDSGADSSFTSKLASWKSVAATLIFTTGIGFGVGQVAAADPSYTSAEALLSMSMQSDYEEIDLYGEG